MVIASVGPAIGGALPRSITLIGPALAGIFARAGPSIVKGGLTAARASKGKVGPSAIPVASGAVRTVSQLGKTRAGLNLKGRDIAIIGGSTAALGITSLITQPGPGGSSAIETIQKGVEDLTPGLENVTKFVQENGALVALIGLGIVVIVLIK